ncbi:DUF2247 family protein [Mechercharimyces sp. CAU 1602]|uniref:DUF2247 family protein n=1 Tax=Mechercharimyces sp. CAU 1602 TaxID=2973933 RepID=UPI002163005F|nr:DUF2247 family protein [Mechercharimyces sp. CAU 1602]MCS1350911.1 DUF2247 family protein [Mechercharimyces sp. CAU 1602]
MYMHLFNNEGIQVNWMTLLIGLKGLGNHNSLIEVKEVINFAVEWLGTVLSDSLDENVIAIASAYESDREDIEKSLKRLSSTVDSTEEIECRKWRFVLLKRRLKYLSRDPLYGMIGLTEFWADFNYPDDSPHMVQGRNINMEPKEYYSQEFYEDVLAKHHSWLERERRWLTLRGSYEIFRGS